MGQNRIFRAVYISLLGSIEEPHYILVPYTGNRHNDLVTARKLLGLEGDISIEDFQRLAKTKKVVFKL